jgi:hypothetical protein
MSELNSLQNPSSSLNPNETRTILQESIKLESLINLKRKLAKKFRFYIDLFQIFEL